LVKIGDLIDDFKMNQQIQGRKDKYNELPFGDELFY